AALRDGEGAEDVALRWRRFRCLQWWPGRLRGRRSLGHGGAGTSGRWGQLRRRATVLKHIWSKRNAKGCGPAQTEEEGEPARQGGGRLHRLQGRRAAAQVHLRPGQDPCPAGDRRQLPAAASDRERREERSRDGVAALHDHVSLRGGSEMKIILTQEV